MKTDREPGAPKGAGLRQVRKPGGVPLATDGV